MPAMFAHKRLAKELQKAHTRLPPGITLVRADDLKTWEMDIRVLDENPIYLNQIFRLVFIFTESYPIEAPEVTFLPVSAVKSRVSVNQSQSQSQVVDLTVDDPPISVPTLNANTNGTAQSQAPMPPGTQSQPAQVQTPDSGVRPIPLHPHIYSNGIICLDLLGSAGWSPVQSVESVCMSIQSMLTGNTRAERPQGDREFCASMGPRGANGWGGKKSGGMFGGGGGRRLKDVRFDYDDETV